MGRLKGSLGKKTIAKLTQQEVDTTVKVLEQDIPIIKRGRGRPKKTNIIEPRAIIEEIKGNNKDIKQQINRLKRIKKQCRSGSIERLDLHHQIKELKEKLITLSNNITPEKRELIEVIIKYNSINRPYMKDLVDYEQFTIDELKHHIEKIKGEKNE